MKLRTFPSTPFLNDWFLNEFPTMAHRDEPRIPKANVRSNEEAYVIELSVPGFSKEDIKVELDNNTLTISAEVVKGEKVEEKGYTFREFGKHSFKRSFRLPENEINVEAIAGNYESGILVMTLPKMKPEQIPGKRKIEIA